LNLSQLTGVAFSLRMPLRFLRGHFRRNVLGVFAVATGAALVCTIELVGQGSEQAFREIIDTMAGQVALQVTSGSRGSFPQEIATTVAATPGVRLAVPVVTGTTFVAGASGEVLTLQAVDLATDETVQVYRMRDSNNRGFGDPHVLLPDAVLLTRTFATRHGLRLGDRLDLETASGIRAFTIRGLLEPEGVARVYGGNLLVMDIVSAQLAFGEPERINRIDIVLDRDADLAAVQSHLTQSLAASFLLSTPEQRRIDLNRVTRTFRMFLRCLALIGVLAAFLIVFGRLSAVFNEQAWQLGVMHAVGVPPLRNWIELLKQAVLFACAGIALGLPIGALIGHWFQPLVVQTVAVANNWASPDFVPQWPTSVFVVAAAVAFVATLLAAAQPAWAALHAGIAATMRSRGLDLQSDRVLTLWIVRAAVLTAAAGCIVAQSRSKVGAWGIGASLLITAATALLAGPTLQLGRVPLVAFAHWVLGPPGRLGGMSMQYNQRRSALVVGTLAVGLGFVLWIWIVARSFEASIVEALIDAGALRAGLTVASANMESPYREAPISEQVVEDLRAIPGVTTVIGQRTIDWPYRGANIAIQAFDPKYFEQAQPRMLGSDARRAGRRDAIAAGEAAAVSTTFVGNLGGQVGDTLTLEAPTGPLSLRIAAVTTMPGSSRGLIQVSRALLTEHWDEHLITRAFVEFAPGQEQAVREAITSRLGKRYRLRILTAHELLSHFESQVGRAFRGLHILAAAVLFVIGVGVADAIAANVTERGRDIATFKAIGVDQNSLWRMLVAESIALCLAGILLAWLMSVALAILWVEATLQALLGFVVELHVPFAAGAVLTLITLGTSVVATLLPARRAVHGEPAVRLRYE